MSIIAQYSRISHHTILDGLTFSVPSQEDFTISGPGSWTQYDLALSEIGVDEIGNKAFIRIGSSINEIAFVGSTSSPGSLIETIGYTASTTNAGPTTIVTFTIPNNKVNWYEFYVTGMKDDFSKSYFGKLIAGVKNVGGTYSILSTVDKLEKTDFSTATSNISADGSGINFEIIGETSTNINWTLKIITPDPIL